MSLHILKEMVIHSLSRIHILDTTDTSAHPQSNLLPAAIKEKLILKNHKKKPSAKLIP